MWIALNDAFFSIVNKNCKPDELLVRARRPQDLAAVFGKKYKGKKMPFSDYRWHCAIPKARIIAVMTREITERITYSNFKDSVEDVPLHNAYLRIWHAMHDVQRAIENPVVKPRDLFGDNR